MAFDAKEFVKKSVVPAVLINAGGFAFQYIDPVLSPFYNKLNSPTLPTISKWAKVATYTGIGLLAEGLADQFLPEGHVGKMAADAGADFLYGLSAATIAADPTYIVPAAGASSRVISNQPGGISTRPNYTTPSVTPVTRVPIAIS
jgi:hypothetical protein